MFGFGGHIKKENRTPTFVGGPHGSKYSPHPYSPSANPAPGHSPPSVSNLESSGVLRMPSFRRPGAVEPKMSAPLFSGYGPTPAGKVRGMGGTLHDYSGQTDEEGLPNLPLHFRGGYKTVDWAKKQRENAWNNPRWKAGILARQNNQTGGGMRGRGAFNNYMQNLGKPMY